MSYILLIIAVLIGALLVLILKPNNKHVRLLLAFSGAYLLSVTILHLLPEVYMHTHNAKKIGILILVGIVIQSVLESFSKGAEHGHIHVHSDKSQFPWLLFISLCIHAFSEGLPIHHAGDNLLGAIIVHKIPIAIVLTTFLLQTNYSKKTIILFLSIFAFMSPLGVLVSDKVAFFSDYHTEITALIIGVFLHISTIILFESSENHKFNLKKFTAIILGVLLTIFTL
ncbi:ZIP family metal transporter [Tenacibaculum finnmarkense genomovar ulcerans]|uniref:ZIP family metal transporter n=1 Tax=Tenacibaculum finnmarkense TaxID=2781243 RepID=UPI00187B9E2E|nr:ZIP family metal transporter [Tenacibaculum finnmarkense]MBE7647852.1 ZIP family metal transporter [Tenacibaculum finnmarkense genomovar ulcerans]MBE7652613.1 ZIP family metal transporter [Tenacibaculum finnmarkense genomovar finnmarkense]MCD8426901.1 ZIP family metal transporter [Tenacibaculum finnmarkense genomovar finnmarkense]MCD8432557.1 ZIP family metal transporter [Tenacibaculum finnmarkense genomovar ulcerans]MCD8444153.1 ZIP family metal transporter [Tenacibaculum finnmarkense geno